MAIYLGLDSSTQSLTGVAIEVTASTRRVVFEQALGFDETLPEYGTRHGVLPSADPLVATAPPAMWADALDRMLAAVRASGLDTSAVRAIAGSAQQHGSVYLAAGAGARLAQLDPLVPLAPQVTPLLSRPVSPIWMDSSTGPECAAITRMLGGPAAVAALTGSRAFERFTGPQIRKFASTEPDCYARTERVHLVSSFLASLLAGRHAPIDRGDGSGMNLMDLAAGRWAPAALRATAPDLDRKLPELCDSWSIVGTLSPFWQQRHRFPAARVVAWSGDNPCSLVGCGLVREGRVAISLGTSDTMFGLMKGPRVDPSGIGHVFAAPTGDYMGLTCFKNGSLARERIRDEYGLDWNGFSDALRRTPPGNGGAVMLPWFAPEITPPVDRPGVRRFDLPPDDAARNVRGVVEGQMLAMARHTRWMGATVEAIRATGGAARNAEMLQVMADVFDATVDRLDIANSAALGAALRAYHADVMAEGHPIGWDEVVADFTAPVRSSRVSPISANVETYRRVAPVHAAREAEALRAR